MNDKNIVLIGFMGTGKTTIGKALAKLLNRTFVDTDFCIEEKWEMSIEEIFESRGEKAFRQLENDIIVQVSKLENTVISTGGGIVLNQNNINHLRANGKLYLLNGDMETIISNLKSSTSNRPLLNTKDWITKVRDLLSFRRDLYYSSADFIIDINKKSITNIVDEIIEIHGNLQ